MNDEFYDIEKECFAFEAKVAHNIMFNYDNDLNLVLLITEKNDPNKEIVKTKGTYDEACKALENQMCAIDENLEKRFHESAARALVDHLMLEHELKVNPLN